MSFIQCLNQDSDNTVEVNSFLYLFNGVPHDAAYKIGVNLGEYTFTGITSGHPIGFVIDGTNALEVIEGTSVGSANVSGIDVVHYYGTVKIRIKADFGQISYNCYYHGYMGGENRLVFSDTCPLLNWLDLSDNANCFKQAYIQGFVDISGGSIITRGTNDGLIIAGDSSLNGTVYLGDSMYIRSDGLVAPGTAENGATEIYVDVSGNAENGATTYDVSGNAENGAAINISIPIDASFSQLGATIAGEYPNDNAGFTTSFSADGTIVAVSARGNNGFGGDSDNYSNNSGNIRVYQYKTIATQGEWDDISNNIGNNYGGVVKSSPTETWVDSTKYYWVQLGADIDNPPQADNSELLSTKFDISLLTDASGNIYIAMAIAVYSLETADQVFTAVYKNYVRVYQYRSVSSDEWNNTYNTTNLLYTDKPVLISGGDSVWTENKNYWVQVGNQIERTYSTERSVAIARDISNNLLLAYGSNDQRLDLFKLDGQSWSASLLYLNQAPIKQILFSADGTHLAINGNNACMLYRIIYAGYWYTPEPNLFTQTNLSTTSPIAISGNGQYVAYVQQSTNDSITIVQWGEAKSWTIKREGLFANASSIALNYDGSIVSIGFMFNDNDGVYTQGGMVRSYKYAEFTSADVDAYYYQSTTQNTSDQTKPIIITESTSTAPIVGNYYWMQIGSDINANVDYAYNGSSVNLSSDGTRLVAGAYGTDRTTFTTAYTTANTSSVSSTTQRLLPDYSFSQPVGIRPYLNKSITKIRLSKPIGDGSTTAVKISEVQVWVNDVNIAEAGISDISANPIVEGVVANLNDASLNTYLEVDNTTGQWEINITFTQEIPLTTVQSIVVYIDPTTTIFTDISFYKNEELVVSLRQQSSNSGYPFVIYADSNLVISRGSTSVYEITNTQTYADVSGGYNDVSQISGYNSDSITTAALYVNGGTDISGSLTVSGAVAFNSLGSLFVAGDLSLNGTLSVANFAANSINADAIDSTVDIEFANKLSVSAADLSFSAATELRVASDVNANGIFDPSTNLATNLTVPANIAIVDGSNGTVYGSYLTLTNKDATAYYNVGKSASGIFNIVNQSSAGVYLASGGISFTGTSDARLKTNVVPLDTDSASAKIMALKPCTYQWKSEVETASDSANINPKTHIGFIAQEVEQVMPELVHPIDHPAGPDYKGVNTTDMIPYLVRTIQENRRKLIELRAMLDEYM
jgi:hypothetical protein